LKRAYYRRAKECHPDLYGGDSAKEEEFKRVVHAFDILSDPKRRREHDERLATSVASDRPEVYQPSGPSIMDSIADDILEEMIVGNDVPRNTTLQNLFLDLTRTTRFVAFREAKNFFDLGQFRRSYRICRKLVTWSPSNILYHFYLAESARRLSRDRMARRHYRICLQLGLMRLPPQRLDRIRRRYSQMLNKQGLFGRVVRLFSPPAPNLSLSAQDEMVQQLDRAFGRMLRKDERKRRRRVGRRSSPKLLSE
jgi:curved DNA-binding protein CbpA